MNRLLDGIKVVDFTHVRAGGGPWIADLGRWIIMQILT